MKGGIMPVKSYNISEKAAENLKKAAKAAKRNASQHLDWILSKLNTRRPKNG